MSTVATLLSCNWVQTVHGEQNSRVGGSLNSWQSSRKLGERNPRTQGCQAWNPKTHKGRRARVVVVDISRQDKDSGPNRTADPDRDQVPQTVRWASRLSKWSCGILHDRMIATTAPLMMVLFEQNGRYGYAVPWSMNSVKGASLGTRRCPLTAGRWCIGCQSVHSTRRLIPSLVRFNSLPFSLIRLQSFWSIKILVVSLLVKQVATYNEE